MKQVTLKVKENQAVSENVYKMILVGDLSEIKNAGEFVEVELKNFYLRRPFSVFDYDSDSLTLLYKVLGNGTLAMTEIIPGENLDVLVGLGNGFSDMNAKKPLLIGGGIGIAPLYNLGKKFLANGITPTFILGFKNKDEVICLEKYQRIGNVIITTDDGSFGYKGNAVSYLKENKLEFDKYYACGPLIMLKYLAQYSTIGYLSLEARMGCGFGACMGCSIETINGPKRVCKEGPVFQATEVKP